MSTTIPNQVLLTPSFGGDDFTADMVNPGIYGMETLMMIVLSKRAAVTQDFTNSLYKQIQSNNDQLKQLNAQISELNFLKTKGPSGTEASNAIGALWPQNGTRGDLRWEGLQKIVDEGTTTDANGVKILSKEAKAAQYFIDNRPVWDAMDTANTNDKPDGMVSKGDIEKIQSKKDEPSKEQKDRIDALITKVQSAVESINSMQQLLMIKFQKSGTLVTESYDMITTALKKNGDSRSGIITKL